MVACQTLRQSGTLQIQPSGLSPRHQKQMTLVIFGLELFHGLYYVRILVWLA